MKGTEMLLSEEQRQRIGGIALFASVDLIVQATMRWLGRHKMLMYHTAWLLLIVWLLYQVVKWPTLGVVWLARKGAQSLRERKSGVGYY